MDIKEIQRRIINFANKRAEKMNYELTPELSYIHLSEELGEVARQLSSSKMRPEQFDENNLKEEIIDVILESLILANLVNIDLDKEFDDKIKKLFQKHEFSE